MVGLNPTPGREARLRVFMQLALRWAHHPSKQSYHSRFKKSILRPLFLRSVTRHRSVNGLATFRDSLSVPCSKAKQSKNNADNRWMSYCIADSVGGDRSSEKVKEPYMQRKCEVATRTWREGKWRGVEMGKYRNTRTALYIYHNNKVRSRNHYCRERVVSIAYFCVCMRACTRAGVCLNACSLNNPARNAPPYYHLRFLWLHYIFWHYLINGTIFVKKFFEHKMCFDFLYNFYLKHFSF
jgi:hypothetical protein